MKMATERSAMNAAPSPLDSMVARAESLYTLPAVAMEVIQLTDAPEVDTRALKECIERDPALAAKLLRVVNSSLFGLSGHVENLTQAIALLGTGPLKLLVLGFSLPDGLLEEIDSLQLRAYWRGALTRAVAARQLVETQWEIPGDEAFLVALLQDIGLLVLLQQLGNPYARFLTQVRSEQQNLVELERESLGFDHRALTASLLSNWKLPRLYTESLGRRPTKCNRTDSPDLQQVVPQVLHLANLLVELVDEHRLSVLPDLLELGEQYCGLDKESLNALVAELEPQVEQLAGVLQVDLGERESYVEMLAEAHGQLAIVAEEAAVQLLANESTLCDEILEESQALSRALQSFT
ncbi:MAG: HDOD domain-containing protein, partial [Aeoliella sp.]